MGAQDIVVIILVGGIAACFIYLSLASRKNEKKDKVPDKK